MTSQFIAAGNLSAFSSCSGQTVTTEIRTQVVGASTISSRVTGGLVASRQRSCQRGRQRCERQPQSGVTGGERAAQISRTHRGPGAADFGGVKGMEGARLQSARAPRFAPLAGRRPTEQRRFVRLLAGPLQSGAIIGGIQWSPSLGGAHAN